MTCRYCNLKDGARHLTFTQSIFWRCQGVPMVTKISFACLHASLAAAGPPKASIGGAPTDRSAHVRNHAAQFNPPEKLESHFGSGQTAGSSVRSCSFAALHCAITKVSVIARVSSTARDTPSCRKTQPVETAPPTIMYLLYLEQLPTGSVVQNEKTPQYSSQVDDISTFTT